MPTQPQEIGHSAEPIADGVATLLTLGDVEFVHRAYKTLLGRDVDQSGLSNYVGQLRGGADKAQLLVDIATSLEGRRRQIHLLGLDALVEAAERRSASRWTRLLRRLTRPLQTSPESLERGWRIVDNHLHRIDAALATQAVCIAALRAEVATLTSRLEAPPPAQTGSLAAATASLAGRQVPPRVQTLLNDLRRMRALRVEARAG